MLAYRVREHNKTSQTITKEKTLIKKQEQQLRYRIVVKPQVEATVAVIVLLVEVLNSSIGRSSSSGSGSGSSSGRGTISSSSINTIRHSSSAHEHAAQHVPGTRYRTWDAIYLMTDTKSVCEASLFRVF